MRLNSTSGLYLRIFDLIIIARTPDGVRTRTVPVCATEPGRPSGLPISGSVTDCGKLYRIWKCPVRLPRFSLRIWGTAPTPKQPVRAEGLGSPGWSAATPWDGCRARSPRPMPRPRRCFQQRPSRTPLGVRAISTKKYVFSRPINKQIP